MVKNTSIKAGIVLLPYYDDISKRYKLKWQASAKLQEFNLLVDERKEVNAALDALLAEKEKMHIEERLRWEREVNDKIRRGETLE